MPNYQDGQIYTIRCRTDNTLIYVGSTTTPLSQRMNAHRCSSKTSDRRIYQTINGDWDNWYIELYEVFPCENKQELNKREGEIIREIGTLNHQIAGRTQQEWKKNWYENHREESLEVSRQYNINNNEARKEYKKKYREEHKAEISAKRIEYYKEVQSKDKEYINKKQNENYAKRKAKKQSEADEQV
jgi:hypothetical protein